ncbi:MAG: hypothetical protein ACRCV9_08020, partial [Burkholderiaceae bacterium]
SLGGGVNGGVFSTITGIGGRLFGSIFGSEGAIAQGVGSLAAGIGSLAASTGSSILGSLAGGLGSLASIAGPVGAILAIGSAIKDRFSYKPTGNTGVNFNFADGGVTGNNTTQVQRRGIFGIGRRTRDNTSALSADQLASGNQIQEQAAAYGRAVAEATARSFVGTVSASFRQEVDKNGKVTKEIGTILGVQYNEPLEKFAQRLAAETALAQLPAQASEFAAGFRSSVDSLSDATSLMVAVQTDIAAGNALIEGADLGQVGALIVDLKTGQESLAETYVRVAQSVSVLRTANDSLGLAIGGTGEDFVRFATDFATAAGGLDHARALFDSFYNGFYTDAERAEAAAIKATADRNTLLGEIGIATDVTRAQFRSMYEAAAATFTPEQTAQWLRAAAAIVTADEATAAWNTTLGNSATALTDAIAGLDEIEAGINSAFEDLRRAGLSDLQRSLLDVDDTLDDTTSALREQRAAAAAAGASAQQLARFDQALARAQTLHAAQTAAAIAKLVASGRSLVSQLGLSRAQQLANSLNAATNSAASFASTVSDGFDQIGDSASNAFANVGQLITDWLNDSLLDDLSSLTPGERFNEAQSQYDALLARALAGDGEAASQLTAAAQALRRETASYNPGRMREIEQLIRAQLQIVAGMQFAGSGGTGGQTGGSSGFGADVGGSTSAGGINIEQLAQLTSIIRELVGSTEFSLDEISEQLNLDLGAFVTALGVNLEELTGETGLALAGVAGQIGVELSDLARSVGVELGELADEQSLLNDSLEAAIATLPQDQRDRLQPLLDAVEAAADNPDGLAIARAALVDAIVDIGGDTADLLGPLFSEINPTDPLDNVAFSVSVGARDTVIAINAVESAIEGLGAIISALDLSPSPPPAPERQAAGTNVAVTPSSNALLIAINNSILDLMDSQRDVIEREAEQQQRALRFRDAALVTRGRG